MSCFGFFAPGPMELVIVGLVAVLLFGNRLPGVARSLGSSFNEFKRGLKDVEGDVREIDGALKDASREVQRAAKL